MTPKFEVTCDIADVNGTETRTYASGPGGHGMWRWNRNGGWNQIRGAQDVRFNSDRALKAEISARHANSKVTF